MKIKKLLQKTLVLCLSLCLFSPITGIHAKSIENEEEYIYPYQVGNDVYYFSSEEDKENFINKKLERVVKGRVDRTLVDSSEIDGVWVTYVHTSSFSKVSKYMISDTKTYTGTVSGKYFGMDYSVGFSHTLKAYLEIPANANYDSRLGMWADYKVNRYFIEEYNTSGSYVENSYYVVSTIALNTTVNPCYRTYDDSKIKPTCGLNYYD